MGSSSVGTSLGPLELLVTQPPPFCNIDCSYCSLPDRLSTKRSPPHILERVFERVFDSGLADRAFTVVWHAGEPLVLPTSFYARAFDLLDRHNRGRIAVDHSFQTNATLIDPAWCDFIRANDLRIGVSVDGPTILHAARRRTRSGQGTHRRVVEGIERLNWNGISFHVITVLTHDSLDYPDEIYDFYLRHGIRNIGFNVEEIEGPHRGSSLQAENARE